MARVMEELTPSTSSSTVVSCLKTFARLICRLFSRSQAAHLNVIILQTKTGDGFGEAPLLRIESSLRDLLTIDFDRPSLELRDYSESVLARFETFSTAWRALMDKGIPAMIDVSVIYATKGETSKVNRAIRAVGDQVSRSVRTLGSSVECEVRFLGATELFEVSQKPRREQLTLEAWDILDGTPTGYVALVALERYKAFLADSSGYLRSYLFEDNIRDFQGANEVNNRIRATLREESSPPFWWLNNGVTIVASAVERHQ